MTMRKSTKLFTTTAGASALVALGFLGNGTALAGSGHGAHPLPPNTLVPMTVGATETVTSAATLATSVASPTHKAVQPSTVAPGGGDWICLNSIPVPTC